MFSFPHHESRNCLWFKAHQISLWVRHFMTLGNTQRIMELHTINSKNSYVGKFMIWDIILFVPEQLFIILSHYQHILNYITYLILHGTPHERLESNMERFISFCKQGSGTQLQFLLSWFVKIITCNISYH